MRARPPAVLAIGARGQFQKRAFCVVGCVSLGHPSGARWREWSLLFDGGATTWLAEAQGRWFVTVRNASWLPRVSALTPGSLASARFLVTDRSEATVLATRGTVAFDLLPGRRYAYADLSGPCGGFATIEAGAAEDAVFVGREVFLDETGLVPPGETVAPTSVCPACGKGFVPVRAKGITVCATCPRCRARLDVDDGRVTCAIVHTRGRAVALRWPLGTRAAFEHPAEPFTLVGVFRRAAGGAVWDEQLWFHAHRGVRWLADVDGEFVYALPIGLGEVPASAWRGFSRAGLEHTTLRAWSGEAPWHPLVGERSDTYEHAHSSGRFGLERDRDEVRASRLLPLSARDVREALARAGEPGRKPLASANGLATLLALQSSRRARLVARKVPGLDLLGIRS